MTDNYIQLKKDNILRLGIKDSKGNETGEFLEFDLEDIELPLRYQEILEEHKKNGKLLQNNLQIIHKRQDVKGKKLFSKNQEDELNELKRFFKREEEIYNMFLGKNGVKKLLNGKKMGWTSLQEIDEIIEKYILPKLKIDMEKIENKIIDRYGNHKQEEALK